MPKRYKLLLTDDHQYVSESLKLYIEDNHRDRLEVVATAQDGREALAQAAKHRPDVVVLDIQMPRLNGIEALGQIKKSLPKALVLVLSGHDDRAHVVDAVRAGADDYLFKKSASPALIVDHIFRALAKTLPAQDELHKALFEALRDGEGRRGAPELTGIEMEILKLAAYKGLNAKQVSAEISGGRMSIRTVATHWQNIYHKLGVRGQAQAVCMAVKIGLISADDVEKTR